MKAGRLRRSCAAALAALTLGVGSMRAQDPPATAQDSAPPPPRPIPADSIPDRARAAATMLSDLRTRLPTDSALGRMDSTLAYLEQRYAEVTPRTAPDRLEVMFYEELLDLDAALGQVQRQLDRWSGEAGADSGRVGALRDTLRVIQDRWVATRVQSWGVLPRALRDQVTGMLRLTDSVAGAIQPVLDRILSAQGDGSRLAIELGFEPRALVRDVPVARGETFYARHGDVFAWACVLATVSFAALTLRRAGGARPR